MGRFSDLTGKRFGKLLVLGQDEEKKAETQKRYERGEIKYRSVYWLCKCDCGKTKSIATCSLNYGSSTSCGCSNRKQNDYEELEDCYRGWDTKHENCFYINKEDYETVKGYCWYKNKNNMGHWFTKTYAEEGRKTFGLHQFIANNMIDNFIKGETIPDHINRDVDNNKRDNIRITDYKGNSRNLKTRSNNTSGKTGVVWVKGKERWRATIVDDNKKRKTRNFKTFEEAVEQRIAWEKELGYIGE